MASKLSCTSINRWKFKTANFYVRITHLRSASLLKISYNCNNFAHSSLLLSPLRCEWSEYHGEYRRHHPDGQHGAPHCWPVGGQDGSRNSVVPSLISAVTFSNWPAGCSSGPSRFKRERGKNCNSLVLKGQLLHNLTLYLYQQAQSSKQYQHFFFNVIMKYKLAILLFL